MVRIDKPQYFMLIAQAVSLRATCARRSVGCVLVNESYHILSTGYNGVPSGMPHCIEIPCSGANLPSGTGLDLCESIHAEQNALLQCPDVMRIKECFTTTFPCIHCLKLLMNTSCETIYFMHDYKDTEILAQRWFRSKDGRDIRQLEATHYIKETADE